jgi:putative hydrolase of the HAD superfamily
MIFFDIDGTLVDHEGAERAGACSFFKLHEHEFGQSADEFVNSWHSLAKKHIRRHLRGEISFQEQRRARLRELFLPSRDLTNEEADHLFASYLREYEDNWALFPETRESLAGLASYKLGVISNGESDQQRRKLVSTGINTLFSVILISGDIGISKPESGIFLNACCRVGQPPDQCYYIGDNLHDDAIAANNAGLFGIWVNRKKVISNSDVAEVNTLSEVKYLIEMHNQRMNTDG